MLAVGKPSSRPRWSPSTTAPSSMKGAPRQRARRRPRRPRPGPRIRVEETVSPSTSTSGTTRVSNSVARREHLRVALGLGAEAEVLAHRDLLGAERLDQDLAQNSSAGIVENSLSNGITTSSSTPRPSITSRLTSNGMISFGARLRVQDLERVRLEGEHRVGPVDHRPVADVDAVEGADRDVARARARRREAR